MNGEFFSVSQRERLALEDPHRLSQSHTPLLISSSVSSRRHPEEALMVTSHISLMTQNFCLTRVICLPLVFSLSDFLPLWAESMANLSEYLVYCPDGRPTDIRANKTQQILNLILTSVHVVYAPAEWSWCWTEQSTCHSEICNRELYKGTLEPIITSTMPRPPSILHPYQPQNAIFQAQFKAGDLVLPPDC